MELTKSGGDPAGSLLFLIIMFVNLSDGDYKKIILLITGLAG